MKYRHLIGLALACVLLLSCFGCGADKKAETSSFALKVNDTAYSAAQVNYEYMGVYQQYSQYGSYFGSVLPDDPYSMGDSDEYKTWGDFYMAQTKEKLQQLTSLCDMAARDKVELDESDKADIDNWIESIKSSAETLGKDDIDAFLSENFGEGVTEEVLRDMAQRETLAMKYVQHFEDSLEFSKKEIDAEYKNDKDSYDVYHFTYCMIGATQDQAVAPDEAGMNAAKAKADDIAAKLKQSGEPTADSFKAVVGDDPDVQFSTADMDGATLTQYQVPFEDWIKDAKRAAGDVEVFEQEGYGWFVILFEGRARNTDPTVNVRHILVRATDADGDGSLSDAEMAEAKTKIEQIKAEWDAGEQTEERFGELANQYSDDGGSNTNGGLYENVYEGQMVPEFNDFCFDPDRKAGDVAIVEDETYSGWHLMYFVGTGDPYTDIVIRESLTEKAMTDFSESLTKDVTVVEGDQFKQVGLSEKYLESLKADYSVTDPEESTEP